MTDSVTDQVRREVEDLHEFFCGWFTGQLPREELECQFLPRFSQDLVFIPPAGRLYGFDELSEMILSGYGSNPGFRIQIRNVVVHRELGSHLLATYEEWQRNALASSPADNGRVSTALFRAGDRLQWLHIHETWLPAEIMAAGPYDF